MAQCRTCHKEIEGPDLTCVKCAESVVAIPLDSNGIPEGVRGWSWGAFLLNWIWAIGNRTWIGLLALVPWVGLIMAIVLGIKGREWAWKNGQWNDVDHFNRVQRRWSAWGIGLIGGIAGIGVAAAIAVPYYVQYVQRQQFGSAFATIESAKPAVTAWLESNRDAPLDEATLTEIHSLGAGNHLVADLNAFTAEGYADIGANVTLGRESGSIYVVTTDGGATWHCKTTFARLAPAAHCDFVTQLERPQLSARFGLWDRAFAQQVINGCVGAAPPGDANAGARCGCIAEKVAAVLPQESVGDGTTPAFKNETQLASVACATREITATN